MLDKAIRELDRERMGLQNQEKKLVGEIKAMAKKGQMVRLSWQLEPTRGLSAVNITAVQPPDRAAAKLSGCCQHSQSLCHMSAGPAEASGVGLSV